MVMAAEPPPAAPWDPSRTVGSPCGVGPMMAPWARAVDGAAAMVARHRTMHQGNFPFLS
jgi:hypothetical protein